MQASVFKMRTEVYYINFSRTGVTLSEEKLLAWKVIHPNLLHVKTHNVLGTGSNKLLILLAQFKKVQSLEPRYYF